jgi:2-iminobutanoate/2-iminopropanoate deaminase
MSQTVNTSQAAAPVAAYSQAVTAGDLLFVSGQIPLDPATGQLVGDSVEAATRQSLTNVSRILEAAGSSLSQVVKATVFLIDAADYGGMDATYRTLMPEPFPAREAVFVAGLPRGARVEISVIAHLKRG